jgi:hypothetical protein
VSLQKLLKIFQDNPKLPFEVFPDVRSFHRIDLPDVDKALSNLMVLPNLRELHFVRSDGALGAPNSFDPYVDSRLATQWSMPRLEQFTYDNRLDLLI